MKTLVTHVGPDLDAICSIWLFKTFASDFLEADMAFVPAGQTYRQQPVDSDPDIVHVDTGFGKYDHHQTNENTCASMLVYAYLCSFRKPDQALERLVNVVNEIDHFREVYFPNPTSDIWNMSLIGAIDGWRLLFDQDPVKIVNLGMEALDGIYKTFQNRIWAEKEIKEKGIIFDTVWGQALGITTTNDEVVHLGQKMGYKILIRKDPNKGYLRVKALPDPQIDLSPIYERLINEDHNATWFLHVSHHMILNGSAKNPDMKPTKLTLNEVIEIFKKISAVK